MEKMIKITGWVTKLRTLLLLLFVFLIVEVPIVNAQADVEITTEVVEEVIEPGDEINVIFTTGNTGDETAKGVTVSIFPHEYIVPQKTSFNYEEIDPGEEVQTLVPVNISANAEAGRYVLKNRVKYYMDSPPYQDSEDTYTTYTITTHSFVDITNLSFTKDLIRPGDIFSMLVTVKNQGTGIARNIRVSLAYEVSEVEEIQAIDAFSPSQFVNPTITYVEIPFVPLSDFIEFVDYLGPKEEKTLEFMLTSDRDTESGSYAVPILINYQDETGEERPEVNDVIGINLKGEPKLDIARIRYDVETIHEDMRFILSVQIENIGTGDATSVVVKMGNDSDSLGTITAGDIGTAIFDLRIDKAGLTIIPINLTYADADGSSLSALGEVTLNIHPKKRMINVPGFEALYAVSALLGIFVTSSYLRKRKNT